MTWVLAVWIVLLTVGLEFAASVVRHFDWQFHDDRTVAQAWSDAGSEGCDVVVDVGRSYYGGKATFVSIIDDLK